MEKHEGGCGRVLSEQDLMRRETGGIGGVDEKDCMDKRREIR